MADLMATAPSCGAETETNDPLNYPVSSSFVAMSGYIYLPCGCPGGTENVRILNLLERRTSGTELPPPLAGGDGALEKAGSEPGCCLDGHGIEERH